MPGSQKSGSRRFYCTSLIYNNTLGRDPRQIRPMLNFVKPHQGLEEGYNIILLVSIIEKRYEFKRVNVLLTENNVHILYSQAFPVRNDVI